jgi:hypothetical protein
MQLEIWVPAIDGLLLNHSMVFLPDKAPISWRSRGGLRWPRTIRIRQDASVTTAEPAIAVARDQFIDRVADYPWDEVKEPCPLRVRKLARNAQHSFGFYIGLAVRYERKGFRAIRIDAELLREKDFLRWLSGNGDTELRFDEDGAGGDRSSGA